MSLPFEKTFVQKYSIKGLIGNRDLLFAKEPLQLRFIFLLVLPCFTACAQIVPFVTIAPTAVHFSSVAYQSIERAEIDVVVSENASKRNLGAITYVAIFMGSDSSTRPYGRIGDLTSVVGDNLCVELTRRGFRVYGWNEVNKHAKGSGDTSRVVESGRAVGAQAIVTGSVTAGHICSSGLLGVGGFKTVVQSATLKVIDVKTADFLMMITINYKVGQNPKVAAEGMAMILQAKMEDPSGSLKERLQKEMMGKV